MSGRLVVVLIRAGSTTEVNGTSKAKHPNQYTYRPKPVIPEHPANHRSTPTPALPPPAQHDHGTRRAGAIANGIIPPPPNTISVHNLHWHLPDHLSAFSDLIPAPKPIALESRAPRTMTYQSKNFYHNQKYGPFNDERDEDGALLLPDDPPAREPITGPMMQLEPPARVRYPVRRITTSEMKKRVRNVLEYVSRVQVEEGKRKERAVQIGIPDPSTLDSAQRVDKDGDALMDDGEAPECLNVKDGPTASETMDDLIKDLIGFQETFANGGFATPMVGSSVPVTPALPQGEDGPLQVAQRMVETPVELSPTEEIKAELVADAVEQRVEPRGHVDMMGQTIEPAEESVDVYRAGEVDTVIADPLEEETAKIVEAAVEAPVVGVE